MQQQPENDAPTATIAPLIVVHGGAGDIPDARDHGKLAGCRLAARLGYAQLLLSNGSAVDAVEAAVRSMELDEYFNAGYGAVLDLAGNAVLEASIQDGRTLAAGAATLFGDILQPITLARRIMERSRHSFLGGAGAVEFAGQHGIEIMRPAGQLVTQYARDALDEFRASGQDGMVEIGHRRRGAEERVFGEVSYNILLHLSVIQNASFRAGRHRRRGGHRSIRQRRVGHIDRRHDRQSGRSHRRHTAAGRRHVRRQCGRRRLGDRPR